MRFIPILLRVLVNAIALALTALLLPGVVVVQNRIWVYLLLAIGFGLINAFVRPLILFFTGRFVIATMGVFILVLNGFLLWLLAVIFPELLHVQGLLSALMGGLIMALIGTLLEAILGLTRPLSLEDTSETAGFHGLERFYTGKRNRLVENVRIQQVYQTMWRYGMDIALEETPLADFRRSMQTRIFRLMNQPVQRTVPEKVRMMLQDLGPMYVKLGQIASSQAQSLPPGWQVELAKLQNTVPPFPSEMARETIAKELGAPVEELFATFDDTPLAAASTAQVHKATLFTGERVVVKVQRPNIVPQVKADLGIMQDVASTLEKRTAFGRDYNMKGVVSEYAENVLLELDYQNEAYNSIQLAVNMAMYPAIHVPKIYPALSSSKVLTMEFVEGVKITNVEAIDASGLDRALLANTFVRAFVKQLVFDGFFHADPHPGNILVNLQTGVVQFLDTGMMGVLDQTQRMNLADLILTLNSMNTRDLARVLISLSSTFKPFNEAAFNRDLARVAGRAVMLSEAGSGMAGTMSAILDLMHQHGLRLQHELTLALKAMLQAEEAAMTLDPSVELVVVALSESRNLVVEQLNVDNVWELVKQEGQRSLKEVVRHLPNMQLATVKWLQQYEKGHFTVHVDTSQLADQVGSFGVAVRYLTVAIIVLGMLVSTAIAATVGVQNMGFWGDFVVFLFFATLVLAAYLVIRMMRRIFSG
jgi:ubiquinone biosynthesis protein